MLVAVVAVVTVRMEHQSDGRVGGSDLSMLFDCVFLLLFCRRLSQSSVTSGINGYGDRLWTGETKKSEAK